MNFKRIYDSIPDLLKPKFPYLLLTIFGASVFEMFSVAIIYPLINIINNEKMLDWLPGSSYLTTDSLIIASAILFLTVNFIKIFVVKFQSRHVTRFAFNLQYEIAETLYKKNISCQYLEIIKRGPPELVSDIAIMPSQLLNLIYLPFFLLVSEVLVCVLIGVLVIAMQPQIGLLAMITVCIVLFILTKAYKKKLEIYSIKNVKKQKKFLEFLGSTFSAYKEIKIYNLHSSLLSIFREFKDSIVDCLVEQQVAISTPRVYLEFIFLLVVVIYISISYAYNSDNFFPTIGLICASAFRLLPSANRITTATQSIVAGLPILNNVVENRVIESLPVNFSDRIDSLYVSNASYAIPNSNKQIRIDDIKFDNGKWYGITGISGAGKTTLLNLLTGFVQFESGKFVINGVIYDKYSLTPVDFAYITQHFFIFDASLKYNVVIDAIFDADQYSKALNVSGLQEVISRLSEGDAFIVGENGINLSGGQRQRLAIARAIYTKRNILILDEATSGLDAKTEASILKELRNVPDMLVIMVTHNNSNLQYCDTIYNITDGFVCAKS